MGLTVMVIALSTVPGDPQPGDSAFAWAVAATPNNVQKSMHVVAYALLLLSWSFTLSVRGAHCARVGGVFLAVVAFGAILEYVQLTIPGRFGSLFDIGLNTLGALGGLALYLVVQFVAGQDTRRP